MNALPQSVGQQRNGAAVVFTALLAIHGVAHFAGVASTLRLIDDGRSAGLLGGAFDVSSPAALRTLSVVWGALGVATVAAALVVWVRSDQALRLVTAVAAASLVYSVVWIWVAVVGVAVNVAVLLTRGVPRVWLFRGVGSPGAMCDEAVRACEGAGIDVVAGACPLMFLKPVAPIHQVHSALRRFNGSLVGSS